jgi:pSer/pThr/pTyr-binding forkhead associated (FHA) protein
MTVKLRVVQGRPQGKSLLFPPGEYVVGRGTECHVRPNSEWVSRQHCLFRVTPDDNLFIRDLGSTNGTLVNGVRVVGERALNPRDQIQVGPLVFEVDPEGGCAATPTPSRETSSNLLIGDTAEITHPGEPPAAPNPATETSSKVYSILPPA